VIWVFLGCILCVSFSCDPPSSVQHLDFTQRIEPSPKAEMTTQGTVLRVAVASMLSPRETEMLYRELLDYIGKRARLDIALFQRKTYREVNDLFSRKEMDMAFICSGPYVEAGDKCGFEAVAVPQIRGKTRYRSYLIVNKDSPFQHLEALRNRIFAFTDPDSNTGKLVPTFWLSRMGERPETFFKETLYTYSHDNSILAVSRALVEGAAVHEHIWEYYHTVSPGRTRHTRILKKSEAFGNPPVVTSVHLPQDTKVRIRDILLSMHLDPAGKAILSGLLIDRFVQPDETAYAPIARMREQIFSGE